MIDFVAIGRPHRPQRRSPGAAHGYRPSASAQLAQLALFAAEAVYPSQRAIACPFSEAWTSPPVLCNRGAAG
jgi:hypothetical protein